MFFSFGAHGICGQRKIFTGWVTRQEQWCFTGAQPSSFPVSLAANGIKHASSPSTLRDFAVTRVARFGLRFSSSVPRERAFCCAMRAEWG